ncbi:MAG TPA: hypothetical protein VI248_11585 [Kineosporiaceae bacterium]
MSDTVPQAPAPSGEAPAHRRTDTERRRETIALLVLSVAAVLTAWSGFQTSQWDGQMSIAFNEAAGLRTRQASLEGAANAARQGDLTIWAVYVQAVATGDERLRSYVETRFTPHFARAFTAWDASGRRAPSPFDLPDYEPPDATRARAVGQQADARFAQALQDNVRGDAYSLLTVLFALAIFFAAVSERLGSPTARWSFTIGSAIALAAGATTLVTFPIQT